MRNPLKFLQEVKQEAFRISWPTKKDTMTGALMVFGLASIAAIFFFTLGSNFKIFVKHNFKHKFLNELVYSSGILGF